MPLKRIDSHVYVYVCVPYNVLFTRAKFEKVHKIVFHQSLEKIFKHIRRAQPDNATPEKLEIPNDIFARCDHCYEIQNGLNRFAVSFGAEKVILNKRFFFSCNVYQILSDLGFSG